jgi:hypothetical protein
MSHARGYGALGVLLLALLTVAGWSAADDGPKKAKPGVRVEVRFTVKELDPKQPKAGSLQCVVRNDTDKAIKAPAGYAQGFDSDVVLFGRVGKDKKNVENYSIYWDLRLIKRGDPKQAEKKASAAVVEPGKELVVFEESLGALLLPLERKNYGWNWQA